MEKNYYSNGTIIVKNLFDKFINCLMKGGNKSIAEQIFTESCMLIKMNAQKDRNFIYKAIRNIKPLIELQNQQKGFRNKLIKPIPIKSNRSYKLAIQWIIEGAQKRSEQTMSLRLYLELLNAYQKKGYAIKKKEELQQSCKLSFFSSKLKDKQLS